MQGFTFTTNSSTKINSKYGSVKRQELYLVCCGTRSCLNGTGSGVSVQTACTLSRKRLLVTWHSGVRYQIGYDKDEGALAILDM